MLKRKYDEILMTSQAQSSAFEDLQRGLMLEHCPTSLYKVVDIIKLEFHKMDNIIKFVRIIFGTLI